MIKDLTELGLEKSKEFLDYFNAELRAQNEIPFPVAGSAGYTSEGYEACLSGWLDTNDGGKASVTWRVLLSAEGAAISVSAELDTTDVVEGWEKKAEEFVSNILLSVLSTKKKTFFKRRHFAVISGSNLPGEYWLPGFRFAPQFPDDDSKLMNAERYLVLDQEIEAIDEWHANELADERSAIYSAYLSLITDVGLYKPVHECRWVITQESGEIKQSRESTQHIDKNVPPAMPQKEELCPGTRFSGSVFQSEKYAGEGVCCPEETRTILRGLRHAKPEKRAAFDKCALLYQLALTIGRYHPTVKISYEYAAVNAIAQELNKEYSGFSDFVRKNIDEDVSELLECIHSQIRSAHWHGGEFALGETDHRKDFLTNPAGLIRFHVRRDAHRVIRKAIFSWVMREIADSNASQSRQ